MNTVYSEQLIYVVMRVVYTKFF